MTTPISNVTYVASGTDTEFVVPFPYILRDFVKVYINKYPTTNFTWLSPTRIKLALAPDAGSEILIQRETKLEPLVIFHDATNLTASDLNLVTLQALHLIQEGHSHITALESLGLTNNENFVLPPLDAGTVLGVLQGRIGALELEAGLNDRISLIEGINDRLGDAEGTIASLVTEVGAMTSAPYDPTVSYMQGASVTDGGKIYRSLQDDNLGHPTSDTTWWEKVSDHADVGAMVSEEKLARQNDVAALAAQIEKVQVSYDPAAEAILNGLVGIDKLQTRTAASIVNLQEALATSESALAQSIEQVSTTVGENTTSIETLSQSVDGVKGTFTVKIDSGGRMVGFSLIANAAKNDTPPDSAFIVKADKFAVGYPGQTGVYPFQIGQVKGQSVVGINGQLMVDGSISASAIKTDELVVGDNITMGANARIGWDKVTGAPNTTKLDANGIYTGTLTANQVDILDSIQSVNPAYVPGYSGWKINKYGSCEFNNGTFRGAVTMTGQSSGYGSLTDKPASLSDINATEAAILSTAGGWAKPGYTLIDGNKIFTGDAYVDTLQIQGNAVTVTDYAAVPSYNAPSANTWCATGCTLEVVQEQDKTYPILLTAFGRGYIKTSSYAEYKAYIRIRHRESGAVSYQSLAAQEYWTGSVYFTVRLTGVVTWKHSPGVGTHHYDLEYYSEGGNMLRQITDLGMTCIGTKR